MDGDGGRENVLQHVDRGGEIVNWELFGGNMSRRGNVRVAMPARTPAIRHGQPVSVEATAVILSSTP